MLTFNEYMESWLRQNITEALTTQFRHMPQLLKLSFYIAQRTMEKIKKLYFQLCLVFFFSVPLLLSWLLFFFPPISNLAPITHKLPRDEPYTVLLLMNYENVKTFLQLYGYLHEIFKECCRMQIKLHMYDPNKVTFMSNPSFIRSSKPVSM